MELEDVLSKDLMIRGPQPHFVQVLSAVPSSGEVITKRIQPYVDCVLRPTLRWRYTTNSAAVNNHGELSQICGNAAQWHHGGHAECYDIHVRIAKVEIQRSLMSS